MGKYSQRVQLVLDRLRLIADDEDEAEVMASDLDSMLDDLHFHDFFGTEGQNDPRGDFRDDEWSMSYIQGVDG